MSHCITVTSLILVTVIIITEFRPVVWANLLDNVPQRFEHQGYRSVNKGQQLPGKLEYQLAESDGSQESRGSALLSYISSLLFRSKLINNVLSYFDRSKSTDPEPLRDISFRVPNNKHSRIDFSTNNEAAKFEASLSHDAPPKTVAAAEGRQIKDEAWANTLFGPTGVLTTIFRLMDDRRKDSIPKRKLEQVSTDNAKKYRSHPAYSSSAQKPNNISRFQSDFFSFPDFFNKAKPVDLAKVFNAFLTSPQGDFEDPVAELPEFLGICNRLSCGDIYKAIDQFRKSDFFTNFQTALQLIQDPKGWEILGDLLSNPELISQFTKGSGLEGFLGSTLPASKMAGKRPNGELRSGDENLGTDFSPLVNGRHVAKQPKPDEFQLPEIAENVDSIDYYSAVEHGEDIDDLKGGIETYVKPEETISVSVVNKGSSTDNEDISLPEISESVDGNIETVIKSSISPSKVPAKSTNFTRSGSLVQRPRRITKPKMPQHTTTARPSPSATMTIVTSSSTTTTRAARVGNVGARRTTVSPLTTKNFRRDNDYYAMYYDD